MIIVVKDLNTIIQLTACFFDPTTGEPANANGGGTVKVYPWGSDVPCITGVMSLKDGETGFYKNACNVTGQTQGGYTALFTFAHNAVEAKGIMQILLLDTLIPPTPEQHFTSAIYPQDFTVFLTDTNITNFQKEPYERNEELNVIDTFDFAFDKVTASAPLEFFKFLNNRAQNTLKIKNKSGNTIYIGKVSGVKSGMEINFANKSLFIESYPLIEDISTDFAIYNIAATNPIKIIKQLLDASVDAAYTVSKIHGLATVLSGISISVDTDGEEENTKSIIQSICEAFNVGVYLEDLTVRAFAVQIFPDDATDITPYLVNLRPKFTNRGDLYADKIMLTYTPTLGGTEATITAGTGDTAKKMTISAPIFIDATSAGLAAERARAIYSQELYEAELEADKTAMFKLGDTVKYPSELGNFICLIIGKNTTRNQITYKVLGVLK